MITPAERLLAPFTEEASGLLPDELAATRCMKAGVAFLDMFARGGNVSHAEATYLEYAVRNHVEWMRAQR